MTASDLVEDPFFMIGELRNPKNCAMPDIFYAGDANGSANLVVTDTDLVRWSGRRAPESDTIRIGWVTMPETAIFTSHIVTMGFSLRRAVFRLEPDRALDIIVPNLENCSGEDPVCEDSTALVTYGDVESDLAECDGGAPDIVLVGESWHAWSEVPFVIADERRACPTRYADDNDTNLASIMGLDPSADELPLDSPEWQPYPECVTREAFEDALETL